MKHLAFLKRGLCIALAGMMLTGSIQPQQSKVYAADYGKNITSDTKNTGQTPPVEVDEITTAEGTEVPKPEAPDSLYASEVTWQTVTLKWSPVSGAAGYIVYRKSAQETDYTQLARLDGEQSTSYFDSAGLTAGVAYTYQVASFVTYLDQLTGELKIAESQQRARVTATPALGAAHLTAVCADSKNVELTWNAVEGAAGYVVLRAEGNNASFFEIADVGNKMTYMDSGISLGLTYRYKIKAYRFVNSIRLYGAESAEAAVTPLPAAPVLSAAAADTGSVRLDWNQSAGAAGYVIERKVVGSSDFAQLAAITSGTVVSYIDNTVRTGGEYAYRIKAYCIAGTGTVAGNYSQEVSVLATLGAPKLTFEDLSQNSITVRWSPVAEAEGYAVYRSLTKDGEFARIGLIKKADVLTYKDTGLTLGVTYYYKVCAYKSVDGKRVYGISSAATAQKCVPAAPKLQSEASGTTSIKLVWEKVDMPSAGSGYYIYQVTDAGRKRIKKCKNTTTSYTVKNLTYGTDYTFQIRAYVKGTDNKVINGAFCEPLTATPQLAAVMIKSVAPSKNGGLDIKWKYTKGQEEDTYLIYRSTKKKSGFKKVATVKRKVGAKSGIYTDKKTGVGKTYYYKIVCRKTMADGKKIKSKYSDVAGAKATPASPTLKLTPDGVNSVRLSWNKIKGSTSSGYVNGYQIYRCTSKKGKFTKAADINSGMTTSYIDGNLKTGTVYYYKIRAFSKVNNKYIYGKFSAVKSIKVVPGQTTLKAEGVDYNLVKMSWNAVAGVSGYKIYRSDAENGQYVSVATVAAPNTTYTDNHVITGRTYYYKIRAYAARNGKNIYGPYSNVMSAVPVLGKPTGLQAIMIDQSQIKLIWNAVAGAETYTILRSTSPNGKYKIASEICTVNNFIDSHIVAGNTYYYKVFAVRGEYQSEATDYVTAVSASLELSTTSVSVKVNGSVKVTAVAKPEAAVSWTSDNPSIAVVTTDGTIYGMKLGQTTVRATANGITKTVAVSVQDKVNAKGVVISKDSGTVNFAAIKAAGYEYVMLRIASGQIGDSTFDTNYTNARAAGLKVGIYSYATARTKADAEKEAYKVLEILKGRPLDYPIVYQMEEQTLLYGLTNAQRNDVLDSFKTYINRYGSQYRFALRTNLEWLTKYLEQSRLNGIDIWVTNYKTEAGGHGYTGAGNVVMWCYTKEETVSGVNGKASVSISYYAN